MPDLPSSGNGPGHQHFLNRHRSLSPNTRLHLPSPLTPSRSHESSGSVAELRSEALQEAHLLVQNSGYFGPKATSYSAPSTPVPAKKARSRSRPPSRRASETSLGKNFDRFAKSYIIPAARWAYSPISHPRKKRNILDETYTIEYSVFRPLRNLRPIADENDLNGHRMVFQADSVAEASCTISPESFNRLISRLVNLMEVDGIGPERIAQGTLGSYFVLNKEVDHLGIEKRFKAGIFKPKDEEPYGPLSPKWSKWLHRTFFPWFFGRSCLLSNQGYISEATACILDRQLLSNIVPYTDIIYLKSPSFYYSYWERRSKGPRPKIGSFQMFLNGYTEAHAWFRKHPLPVETAILEQYSDITLGVEDVPSESQFQWSQQNLRLFREELEKLVILDYIMRNTDRGADNWMIKIEWKEISRNRVSRKLRPQVKIGAIDSGLAFPWKHPDEWRSFPFGWLFLPASVIGQPFSRKTREHYLPLLTSKYWWEQTVVKMREVCKKEKAFKEKHWRKQLAVLKGQAFNVVEILKLGYAGPLELTRREHLLIWDDRMNVPVLVNSDIVVHAMESSIYDMAPRNNIDTIHEDGDNEADDRTPLLPSFQPRKQHDNRSLSSNWSDNNQEYVSGFDLNASAQQDQHEETDTRRVVIERLEKVDSKAPVFTWC